MTQMQDFIFDKIFEKLVFADGELPWLEYERCTFRNCNFYGATLAGLRFCNCRFESCDLSMAYLDGAVVQDIAFADCKILGVRFDRCSRFGFAVSFAGSLLDNSSFRGTKLKKTVFDNCRLREVDFSESDLNGAVFGKSDLDRAVFHFTNLEQADFRTASGYSIDPEVNRLKGAKFSLFGLPGLLGKYGIEIGEG